MGVVLWILIILLGLLIAVICTVLLAPVRLELITGTTALRFRFRYMFLDILYDKSKETTIIKLFGATIIRSVTTEEDKAAKAEKKALKDKEKAEKKARKKKEKAKKKKKKKKRNVWGVIQEYPDAVRKWLKQIFLLLFRIITALRIDYLNVNAVIATPDPYWTGVLYGYSEALRGIIPRHSRVTINLHPDFEDDTPQGAISLSITYRMYRLTWAMVRFLWAVPKIDTIKVIWKL